MSLAFEFATASRIIFGAGRLREIGPLAKQFGRNRCWLAGDAAHQTGPVGVQSMNVGFCEAEALSSALHKILRESGSFDFSCG